jgi:hypothetical protein
MACRCSGTGKEDAREAKSQTLWKSVVVLAVTLAVTAAKTGRSWRGWMRIELTRDASLRPANAFEDRVSTVRQRPAVSAQDEKSLVGIR